jgi:uncharacterized phage-like protein YoqJ
MILTGTGHRPNKLGNEYDMRGPVSDALRAVTRSVLLREEPEEVVSGVALGFDMILAEEAIDLGIFVTAAIPFEGQENAWPEVSKRRYRQLLAHELVTAVICAPGGHSNHKYDHRNRWMLTRAMSKPGGKLLAAWDGTAGGTRNTVMYAREIECPIIHLRPDLTRTIWEIANEPLCDLPRA